MDWWVRLSWRQSGPHAQTLLNLLLVSFKQFLEQQLFQRSRQFLRRLGRSLGEGSALYQQVVSVLQGSSASRPEDLEKVDLSLHFISCWEITRCNEIIFRNISNLRFLFVFCVVCIDVYVPLRSLLCSDTTRISRRNYGGCSSSSTVSRCLWQQRTKTWRVSLRTLLMGTVGRRKEMCVRRVRQEGM